MSLRDVHTLEISKSAKIILYLNLLFDIKFRTGGTVTRSKEKRTSYPRENASRSFLVIDWEIENFHNKPVYTQRQKQYQMIAMTSKKW